MKTCVDTSPPSPTAYLEHNVIDLAGCVDTRLLSNNTKKVNSLSRYRYQEESEINVFHHVMPVKLASDNGLSGCVVPGCVCVCCLNKWVRFYLSYVPGRGLG